MMRRSFVRRLVMVGVGALWLALPARFAAAQEKFTLAVIPDAQQEVLRDDDDRLANRLRWLVAQRQELNLAMVLQVGDLHNWDTPDHAQYERSSRAFKILDEAGVPYALAVGNHDTAATKEGGSAAPGNTHDNQRNTSTFNTYYPASRLKVVGKTWQEGKVENAYRTFRAGGLDWLVVTLELWPRAEAVAWAKKVVDSHPRHNAIILTHAFLTAKGQIQANNGGYGDKSPQYVFENLIRPCPNVRLVFSGHVGSHGHRTDKGEQGNTVYEFLQCYHDGKTNPVRLLEIDTKQGTIATRVYCPATGETKEDGSKLTVRGVEWVKPK